MIKKGEIKISMTTLLPFVMHVPCTNYNNLKREQAILIPIIINVRKNQFITIRTIFEVVCKFHFFLFVVKNEKKINKFSLNNHRYMVQPLVLHIFWCSF